MRIRIGLQLKKTKKRNDGKCPVYARCVMDGRRIELSTSIFVDVDDWDNSRQEIAGKSQEVRILNNLPCWYKSQLLFLFLPLPHS